MSDKTTNVPLEPYYASDRRCYNGAFCSDLQREADRIDALEKRMKKAEPSASCTYFPMEGKYMTFVRFLELTGKFHTCKQSALIEAIQALEKEKKRLKKRPPRANTNNTIEAIQVLEGI
jgi:hypothetical protein